MNLHFSLPESLPKKPVLVLIVLVQLIVLLFFAKMIAQLSWQIFLDHDHFNQVEVLFDRDPAAEVVKGQNWLDYPLFGVEPVKPVTRASKQPVRVAPEVAISLLGLVFVSENEKDSMAMLRVGDQEGIFRIGDSLANNIDLLDIQSQYIVVLFGENEREIYLEGVQDSLVSTAANDSADRIENSINIELDSRTKVQIKRYQNILRQNPLNLMSVIKFRPYDQGNVQGFQIEPGVDKMLFYNLGFKVGDVVQSIYGLPVSSPENLRSIFQKVTSSNIDFLEAVIHREGASQIIRVALD